VKSVILVATMCEIQMSSNDQGLQELQDFQRALESYPARFALDPTITFEQHRSNLIPVARAKSAGA